MDVVRAARMRRLSTPITPLPNDEVGEQHIDTMRHSVEVSVARLRINRCIAHSGVWLPIGGAAAVCHAASVSDVSGIVDGSHASLNSGSWSVALMHAMRAVPRRYLFEYNQ